LSSIAENISDVKARIAAAAKRSGRAAEDVALICVTKTRSADEIKNVLESGEFQLGENRVQELMEKYEKVQDIAAALDKKRNIMWNLIGHLQRNKVKYITGRVALIQSVDSLRLAEEIDARFALICETAQVLIQINPAGETQKSGVQAHECGPLADEIDERFRNIKLRGLMAVVPFTENPEDVRRYFYDARKAFDILAGKRGARSGFEHLSMGMTNDFEVAIEEGATMVRVGAAIFGPRVV
jgi:pyridoxal phosphate enzyme (YggS family)